MPIKYHISAGQRFGKLTVIARSDIKKSDVFCWLCRCDCGGEIHCRGATLGDGRRTSCGCGRIERVVAAVRRHGFAAGFKKRDPTYVAWMAMSDRCKNPRHPSYKDYGARGISICDRWHSFENFLADMGKRPDPKLSLDRINNDGNYEPGNCRWATRSQQNANKRHRAWRSLGKSRPGGAAFIVKQIQAHPAQAITV